MQCNSTRLPSLRLPLLTIGFCTDLAGEEKLRAAGVERIWRRGDGIESLDAALLRPTRNRGAAKMTCPHCHNTDEIRPYAHLPKIVLPPCRFDDAEYMAEARRLYPHVEFVRNEPLPLK